MWLVLEKILKSSALLSTQVEKVELWVAGLPKARLKPPEITKQIQELHVLVVQYFVVLEIRLKVWLTLEDDEDRHLIGCFVGYRIEFNSNRRK